MTDPSDDLDPAHPPRAERSGQRAITDGWVDGRSLGSSDPRAFVPHDPAPPHPGPPGPGHGQPPAPRGTASLPPASGRGAGEERRFPSILAERPVSVLIHGSSRDLVSLTTYGLVGSVGSEFSWIDIRIGNQPPTGTNPVALGLIPKDRLVVVTRLDEMAPTQLGSESVRAVIRRDEPLDSMERLSEYVRLPRPVQLALAKTVPGARPGIVVVANAHRLIALYDATSIPEILREITSLGTSVFIAFADEPPRNRSAFDVVLGVHGNSAAEWADALLEFEQVPASIEALRGRRVPLSEMGALAGFLEVALDGRGDPPTA